MPGGNKKVTHTWTNLQLKVTTRHERVNVGKEMKIWKSHNSKVVMKNSDDTNLLLFKRL